MEPVRNVRLSVPLLTCLPLSQLSAAGRDTLALVASRVRRRWSSAAARLLLLPTHVQHAHDDGVRRFRRARNAGDASRACV